MPARAACDVRVRFLGTGTPLGTGGRLQACILLEADGERLLLDCGMTSMAALGRANVEPGGLSGVAISHLHGDHVGGVPLLLLDARIRGYAAPPLLGPPALAERIK